MNDFKSMLKYLRKRENLSQEELAKKLGISKSAISMYERGQRQPDFETEEKIADLFNVSLNFLRGRDDSESKKKVREPLYDLLNDSFWEDVPDFSDVPPIYHQNSLLDLLNEIEDSANATKSNNCVNAIEYDKQLPEDHYSDEAAKIAQEIYNNKELSLLFDAAKDATPEDLQTVHTMLMALKKKENHED